MAKKILLAKNPEELKVLRTVSAEANPADPATKQLVADMFESMKSHSGIGLSAPQVGVAKRVIVAEYLHGKDQVPRTVLINPKITWSSNETELEEEGCLSFPELFGMVRRPIKISYEAVDENGQPISSKASGLLARVIQHELDHLNGVLFIDKVEGDLYTYEVNDGKTL